MVDYTPIFDKNSDFPCVGNKKVDIIGRYDRDIYQMN